MKVEKNTPSDTKPEIQSDTWRQLEQVPVTDDIVQYTLACVLALAPRTSEAIRQAVDRKVRDTFGGNDVWVTGGAAQQRQQRNAKIKQDYLAGERMELLERRYQISRRRIFQIIKSK